MVTNGAIRIPAQPALLSSGRVLVWFSCGAASACAAKVALAEYPQAEIIYCDLFASEHADNARFMRDCERWLGVRIKILRSKDYRDIYDVFTRTGWLVGPAGARCSAELKRAVREDYQEVGDIHVFGLTADESKRIGQFNTNNPELYLWWALRDAGMDKQACIDMIAGAGIALPAMYVLGYRNNNCIGCVKGGKGYWNKIRRDFPSAFARMASLERRMNARVLPGGVWLDELPPNAGRYASELTIECGPVCSPVSAHNG